jgi:succinate dehydrogenase/fumarate reductase flavoprotein subunit
VDSTNYDAKTLFLAPEALRGSGGLLLSVDGVRFVNELAPRDVVTGHIWRDSSADAAIMAEVEVPIHKQPPTSAWAYLVLDHKAVQAFGSAAFGFYHKAKHFFTEVSGTKGLAAHIAQANAARDLHNDVPEAHVRQTFEEYAQAADGMREDAFGKTVFPTSRYQRAVSHGDYPLFVAMIQPVLHYTMGGLKIDTTGAMLDENSDAIPGLYGAGEVTAGVHGANRLGGNSLLECVVFGRLAGKHATLYGQQVRQHIESEVKQGHDEL